MKPREIFKKQLKEKRFVFCLFILIFFGYFLTYFYNKIPPFLNCSQANFTSNDQNSNKSFINSSIFTTETQNTLNIQTINQNFSNFSAQSSNFTIKGKIFFGFITSPGSTERREYLWKAWLKDAVEKYHYSYAFILKEQLENNYVAIPTDDSYYDPTPESKGARDPAFYLANKERGFKRLTMMKYFIEHTDAKYLMVTGDDVIFQVERLEWLMEQFDKDINDTETDIRIWGECVSFQDKQWLQGGVGFAMTRAAARECLKYKEKWMKYIHIADDLDFTEMLKYIGFPIEETETPFFIGHGLPILRNNALQLKICPQNIINSKSKLCGTGLHPISKVIAYHENNNQNRVRKMEIIRNLQNNEHSDKIFWYNVRYSSFICTTNKSDFQSLRFSANTTSSQNNSKGKQQKNSKYQVKNNKKSHRRGRYR